MSQKFYQCYQLQKTKSQKYLKLPLVQVTTHGNNFYAKNTEKAIAQDCKQWKDIVWLWRNCSVFSHFAGFFLALNYAAKHMEIIELSIDLVTEIITKQMNSVCMCVCACVLLARRRCLVGKEKRLRNDHKFGETHITNPLKDGKCSKVNFQNHIESD